MLYKLAEDEDEDIDGAERLADEEKEKCAAAAPGRLALSMVSFPNVIFDESTSVEGSSKCMGLRRVKLSDDERSSAIEGKSDPLFSFFTPELIPDAIIISKLM